VKGSNLSPAIAAYFALMALHRARRSSQGIAALNLTGDGFTEPMFFQVIVRKKFSGFFAHAGQYEISALVVYCDRSDRGFCPRHILRISGALALEATAMKGRA